MPSPIGHAMAGAMTAWIADFGSAHADEASRPPATRSFPSRLLDAAARAVNPLTIACAVLAVTPDFDIFFHTHRTYSHSLGAAAIVWAFVALVAWRLRLPVVKTASICAAAYASHVLLDWLGRDDSPNGGLMVLWPVATGFYRSGLDMFYEYVAHRRFGAERLFLANAPALAHEMLILAPPFLAVLALRLRHGMRGEGVCAGPGTEHEARERRRGARHRAHQPVTESGSD